MFPDSFHPQRRDLKYDYSGPALYYRRTERPPKYYFIDFGLSKRYKADDLPVLDLVLGGDQPVPEAIDITSICDPFSVDVYYLGNALRAFLPEVSCTCQESVAITHTQHYRVPLQTTRFGRGSGE